MASDPTHMKQNSTQEITQTQSGEQPNTKETGKRGLKESRPNCRQTKTKGQPELSANVRWFPEGKAHTL